MNPVDIGILAIIGLFAVGGLTRGLLLGIVDLVLLGLAVIVATRGGASIAAMLGERGFPPSLAASLGFFAVFSLTLTVTGIAARILLAPLRGVGAGSLLGWLNSLLGMALGAIRGIALVFLALLAIQALPSELGYRPALAASRLAAPILTTGQIALATGLAWAGIDRDGFGLPLDGVAGGGSRVEDVTDSQDL